MEQGCGSVLYAVSGMDALTSAASSINWTHESQVLGERPRGTSSYGDPACLDAGAEDFFGFSHLTGPRWVSPHHPATLVERLLMVGSGSELREPALGLAPRRGPCGALLTPPEPGRHASEREVSDPQALGPSWPKGGEL